MRILVTGGTGFIGSALVRHLVRQGDYQVCNLDALTYAAQPRSLTSVEDSARYELVVGSITDPEIVAACFTRFQPDAVMHLAAESHVDRSITGPGAFIQTNMVGTGVLLDAAREYWAALPGPRRAAFRFHHISTDEVYGDLAEDDAPFSESTPYSPSSPYSASKAGSDHLVRAWARTYGLPTLITNCSNNYGPCQFPEKLIPNMILRLLRGESLPVYGDGRQIRDWLHVQDHVEALVTVLTRGQPGETYNIGGRCEQRNIDLVHQLCALFDQYYPERKAAGIISSADLITHVTDRPGHDRRYAIDQTKIEHELGWKPRYTFEAGLRETLDWYIDNRPWWESILDGSYREAQRALGAVEA